MRRNRFIYQALRLFAFLVFLASIEIRTASASSEVDTTSPENFKVEVTAAAWLLNTSGSVQSGSTPIDLKGDLGVGQNQPTFLGQFVFKPSRKHRIVLEGTPFALSGTHDITRTIIYHGQAFNVNDTVASQANLNYAFGGYQYDVISRSQGHFGLEAGATYLDASATIRSATTGITSTKRDTIGLPLAGAEGRIFPIPGHRILEFNGGVKGMSVGGYGQYVQGAANGGICLGPVTIEAGYRIIEANLHGAGSNQSGISPHFRGAVFSLVFRR